MPSLCVPSQRSYYALHSSLLGIEGDMAESQLRKGVLELIVLAALEKEPAYGGALIERLGVEVSTGTLYPLLTRMKKHAWIDSHWEESPSGPPRKIYSVTEKGSERISDLAQEWRALSVFVNDYLEGIGK
ncbi:Transcription regulator padR [Corynebacterium pseudotuberculosis P54B96]|nr:Transcription regulator padR [Corynebacterium pseudotuberculosis P54B96]AKC74624.1 Transcriptional regulator, PadR family [Corynebacterium pseudotuberculosis]